MKPASNRELIHKINNQLGLIVSSIEAMEYNLDNKEFCKEVITEILRRKDDFKNTVNEIKEKLGGQFV